MKATRCFYGIGSAGMPSLFREELVTFEFHSGFAKSQKIKNVLSMEQAVLELHPNSKVLEVSTGSPEILGQRLSAFNLPIKYKGKVCSVEAAFQASKIFSDSGPHWDLLEKSSIDAKKDSRIKNLGTAVGYSYEGSTEIANTPDAHFYDALYIIALLQNQDLLEALSNYDFFTDTAFNKSKLGLQKNRSFNSQAKSCAIAATIYKSQGKAGLKNQVDKWLTNPSQAAESLTLF